MPIYEYKCSKCESIEEIIQTFSDKKLKTCIHCQGKLNKLISKSSFHLKGKGWYVTDYGKNTKQNEQPSKPKKKNTTNITKNKEKKQE